MVAHNPNRTRLLQGTACAAMAAALALTSQQAAAQAFNATPTVVDGNATIDRSVTGQDTITVETDTAVIDWEPILGQQGEALTFLPEGNTATYQDLPGAGGFAVLNRILPTPNGDVVVFDGTVITRLQDASGGFSSGGSVAFYSPTGILVGPTAVFDVGNLLLTTLDPDLNSFAEFATGGGSLDMFGATGQTTGVTIQPGAQIIASGEGSFFAVVAPFVDMGGTSTVNGTTAYVAGEQVSMTFSNGLFDIVVPVGTSVPGAVVHTGTSTGPASTGVGDNHLIYVVAPSQQTPVQMLLSGNLGFAPAQTAGMDNGDIILSAGRNVFGREIEQTIGVGPADILIDNAQMSSSLLADASRNLQVSAQTGDVSIAGDAVLRADAQVLFQAFNAFDASVDGELNMAARDTPVAGGSTGGIVRLEAFGGATIDITGDVFLEDGSVVQTGDTTGGTAAIFTDGGTIIIGGSANVDASTNIIGIESSPTSVTGGLAQIGAINGGTITIAGAANLLSYADPFSSVQTVTARGGTSEIFVGSESLVQIGGATFLDAMANAGTTLDSGNTQVGADAFGGLAIVSVFDGGEISIDGDVIVSAAATGGNGQGGGDAFGGNAGVAAGAGEISVTGSIIALAFASGGDSNTGVGGDGGDGTGGQVFVQADGTLTEAASLTAGNVELDNSGLGGAGGNGDGSTAAGNGGNGAGGLFDGETGGAFVLAGADRGTLILGNLSLASVGIGGQGGNGGPGQAGGNGGAGSGGTTQIGTFLAAGDGSVGLGSATFANVSTWSDGIGGSGGSGGSTGDLAGNGGVAIGGATFLTARLNSQVSAGTVDLSARADGGAGNLGGQAIGGTLSVEAAGAEVSLASLAGSVEAIGGFGTGPSGSGGGATGGDASIDLTDSSVDVAGAVTISSFASGGAGAQLGGTAAGGTSRLTATGSSITTGDLLTLAANALGGDVSELGGTAGDATGGTAELIAEGAAAVELHSAQISAGGKGGSGAAAGQGIGGDVLISASGAETSLAVLNNVTSATGDVFNRNSIAAANGTGGDITVDGGGNAGLGAGGTALIQSLDGASIDFPQDPGALGGNFFTARGFGGASSADGTAAGDAQGGVLQMRVSGGTLSTGPTVFSAFSQGGSSSDTDADVAGGNATGGQRIVIVENGGTLNASFVGGVSSGAGGNGSGTGDGGDATGGEATLTVNAATANLVGANVFAAQPTGGSGANGGDATGGTARVVVDNGGTLNLIPDAQGLAHLVISARATGGVGSSGNGGTATAGLGSLSVNDSTYNADLTTIDAEAFGGAAANGMAGAATAGEAELEISGGTLNAGGATRISATATGGEGLTSGGVTGGGAQIEVEGGTINALDAITVTAAAIGSSGPTTGGFAEVDLSGASNLDLTSLDIDGSAQALTGSATAGTAELTITDEAAVTAEAIGLVASAATDGGEVAIGGDALVLMSGSGLDTESLSLTNGAAGGTTNTAGAFVVQADLGAVTVGELSAESIASTGGATGRISALGGNIFITGSANVAATGDIEITALDGNVVGDPDPLQPTADLAFRSDGTIRTIGNDDNLISFGGASLALVSRELDIGAGSRIGALSVVLESLDTDNTAILGGATEEAGYTLTQDEAARIEAGSVLFSAPQLSDASGDAPDVLIRDLTITGSADEGVSQVGLFTEGVVRVEGVLAYADAGVEDVLEIAAGERLEVVTPGGIGVVDPDGNPTGSLQIFSNNIWAADAETIAQLQANPDFSGRNDLLSGPAAGSDDPLGYLRAGSMSLFVGETLYVRNTGNAAEPGGILVGEGGLRIVQLSDSQSSAGDAIDIVAYGRQRNADGSFATGEAFFELVDFTREGEDPSEYTDSSELNDCLVNGGECGDGEEPPEEPELPEEEVPPVNNPAVIDAPISATDPIVATEEEADSQFGSDFPGLVSTPLLTDETVLTDPVASGGDSSLYGAAAEDDDDEDGDEDEEDEGGDDENAEDGE